MEEKDQLLEPTDGKVERKAGIRFSREGGLEELVRELLKNGLVTRSLPFINFDFESNELVIDVGVNIGSMPHPGHHFSIGLDLDVSDIVKKIEASQLKPPTTVELLRQEILTAGGNPDDIITPDMTEEKAKEVLDALAAP